MTRLKAAILPTLLMVSFTATALEGEKKVDFAARVVAVQGQVLSRPEANKKATPHALKTGDKLYPGDVINTGSDSRLKLLLADWSVIDLGPSTLFKIGEMTNPNGKTGARNVKLGMKYGTIRAAVNRKLEKKSKFQVRTPSATMGVRGTEFVVKAENAFMKSGVEGPKSGGPVSLGKTEVIVTKGKVGVALQSQGRGPSAQQKTFAVTAGKSFTATTGSAGGASSPKVSNVSQTQMTSAVSSASMKDNTFMSAVSVEASSDEKKEGSSNSDDSDSKSGKSKIGRAHV